MQERRQPGEPDPVWKDTRGSLVSLGEFFNPVPAEKIRTRLDSPKAWGKYSLAWLASRVRSAGERGLLPQPVVHVLAQRLPDQHRDPGPTAL